MANQPVFFIKQNDTSRSLKFYPKATPQSNFTGATIVANMAAQNGGPIKISRAGSPHATIGTDSGGTYFQYDWRDGDTNLAGDFDFEFEVTLSGGKVETYPNRHYITVRIKRDLA